MRSEGALFERYADGAQQAIDRLRQSYERRIAVNPCPKYARGARGGEEPYATKLNAAGGAAGLGQLRLYLFKNVLAHLANKFERDMPRLGRRPTDVRRKSAYSLAEARYALAGFRIEIDG